MPPSWRLLRALSNFRRKLAARLAAHRKSRRLRLHRMNEHILWDIGLARMKDEDRALERLHLSVLPLQKRDD